MPANESTVAPRRRRLGFLFGAFITGIALLVWITTRSPDGIRTELAAIQAAGEPFDDASLDAWIGRVPASENGAPAVLGLIDGTQGIDDAQIPPRGHSWDAAKLTWAATERARLQTWRDAMHRALRASRFRYPIVVTNLATPHLAPIKDATSALAFWAVHSAAIEQPDEAATALLDALRAARTLDDEPLAISCLVRGDCLTIATLGTENVLSLAALPEARLAELQAAFLAADRPETVTRALISARVKGLEACRASLSEYFQLIRPFGVGPGTFGQSNAERIALGVAQAAYQLSGAQNADSEYYLKTLRELIGITRLAGPARVHALRILQNRFTAESARWNRHRSRALAVGLFLIIKRDQRASTLLRSAATACAIERFRTAHQGRPPLSLADLVPIYLPAIPLDPTDDHPLRFRPLLSGYVVYGVGLDGEDNQGNLMPRPGTFDEGVDVCFTVER